MAAIDFNGGFDMKICPICGKVVSFNSYFGAYICNNCFWEDAKIGDNRNKGLEV